MPLYCVRALESPKGSVQFSSVPSPIRSSGGHKRRLSRDSLPVFSAGCPCEQFWQLQGCSLFDVVHPAFPLPITVLPTLLGALKNGFGEAVMACDMPDPCKLPSLDSCQKRFLWTHILQDYSATSSASALVSRTKLNTLKT